ncbi:hypothetical protein BD779DRAFT_1467942 [Infundibulicybe gibba]|nr:hypothetical protein BD779DRAFT_1467942 [Infundibulicybe gibba]
MDAGIEYDDSVMFATPVSWIMINGGGYSGSSYRLKSRHSCQMHELPISPGIALADASRVWFVEVIPTWPPRHKDLGEIDLLKSTLTRGSGVGDVIPRQERLLGPKQLFLHRIIQPSPDRTKHTKNRWPPWHWFRSRLQSPGQSTLRGRGAPAKGTTGKLGVFGEGSGGGCTGAMRQPWLSAQQEKFKLGPGPCQLSPDSMPPGFGLELSMGLVKVVR